MLHARKDYNRFQDPALTDPSLLAPGSSPIGENEPVMLFRAQDKHFPAVLAAYVKMLEQDALEVHSDHTAIFDVIFSVEEHIERAHLWQAEHGCKVPDLPAP